MVDTETLSNVTVGSPITSQDSGPTATIASSDGEPEVDNETDTDGAFWEATTTRPPVPTDSEGLREYALPHV